MKTNKCNLKRKFAGNKIGSEDALAKRFNDRVRTHGITVNQVLTENGISRSAISHWMTYNSPPVKVENQRKIIKAFLKKGIRVDELVERALSCGGRAESAMRRLIEEGLVEENQSTKTKTSLLEAGMKKQFLYRKTLDYFSIDRDPFMEPEDDDAVFLKSPRVRKTLDWIMECATRGEDMFALIGEVGSGKTTLANYALNKLKAEHEFKIIWPELPDKGKLTSNSLLTAILRDLTDHAKLHTEMEMKSRVAKEILTGIRKKHGRVLVIIDEGHDLSLKVLHSLKRMNEWRHGYRKLMSIMILAQPEMRYKLANYDVREFTQRLSVFDYPGLASAEPYIRFRFEKAGVSKDKLDRIVTKEAFGMFETKCNLLKKEAGHLINKRKDESALTPLIVQNLWSKAMNLAAEMGDTYVQALHVEKIQEA